jgi:hypothetical protein
MYGKIFTLNKDKTYEWLDDLFDNNIYDYKLTETEICFNIVFSTKIKPSVNILLFLCSNDILDTKIHKNADEYNFEIEIIKSKNILSFKKICDLNGKKQLEKSGVTFHECGDKLIGII